MLRAMRPSGKLSASAMGGATCLPNLNTFSAKAPKWSTSDRCGRERRWSRSRAAYAGQVLAIDADAGALAFGRRWLKQRNIEFTHSTVEDYKAEHAFDAVVGRAILMHVKNPVAVLRQAAIAVRSGGIVCFIEPWLETAVSHPRVETYQQFMDGAHNALRAGGLHLNMGARLYSDFIAAGLPAPQLYGFADLGAGANASVFDRMLDGARSGIRAQVPEAQRETALAQVEALGRAMREETATKNATVLEKIMVGAWVIKPQ